MAELMQAGGIQEEEDDCAGLAAKELGDACCLQGLNPACLESAVKSTRFKRAE
jgi:hypothetical protein